MLLGQLSLLLMAKYWTKNLPIWSELSHASQGNARCGFKPCFDPQLQDRLCVLIYLIIFDLWIAPPCPTWSTSSYFESYLSYRNCNKRSLLYPELLRQKMILNYVIAIVSLFSILNAFGYLVRWQSTKLLMNYHSTYLGLQSPVWSVVDVIKHFLRKSRYPQN